MFGPALASGSGQNENPFTYSVFDEVISSLSNFFASSNAVSEFMKLKVLSMSAQPYKYIDTYLKLEILGFFYYYYKKYA